MLSSILQDFMGLICHNSMCEPQTTASKAFQALLEIYLLLLAKPWNHCQDCFVSHVPALLVCTWASPSVNFTLDQCLNWKTIDECRGGIISLLKCWLQFKASLIHPLVPRWGVLGRGCTVSVALSLAVCRIFEWCCQFDQFVKINDQWILRMLICCVDCDVQNWSCALFI